MRLFRGGGLYMYTDLPIRATVGKIRVRKEHFYFCGYHIKQVPKKEHIILGVSLSKYSQRILQ